MGRPSMPRAEAHVLEDDRGTWSVAETGEGSKADGAAIGCCSSLASIAHDVGAVLIGGRDALVGSAVPDIGCALGRADLSVRTNWLGVRGRAGNEKLIGSSRRPSWSVGDKPKVIFGP